MYITLDISVQKPHSEFFDSGTCVEAVEAVEGFMEVDTEDEVSFEEFIEGCHGCLPLARDGRVVNDDIEPLNVVLLFTNTQQEGLPWFQTRKKGLNTGSNLQKRRERDVLMAD